MKKFSKYAMLVSTLLLCVILLSLFRNQKPFFERVKKDYEEGRAVNLSDKTESADIAKILIYNGYTANETDAKFIADTLAARLRRHMVYANLYHLQKRAFGKVPALVADSAKVLTNKLEKSYEAVGWTTGLPQMDELATVARIQSYKSDSANITIKLHSDNNQNLSNAIVRLTEYYTDTVGVAHSEVIAYAKTDDAGRAVFTGLDKSHGYSVMPIKHGFEYGYTKGVKEGKFKKNITLHFEQLEHRIQMIDNATIKQIKNDGTITVRTPEEYKTEVIKWFVLILFAWWLLALLIARRQPGYDPWIIAALMFLTGLCVIVMYAIQNPLTEELRGTVMASGVLWGIGIITLLQFVDFIKFYQNRTKINFDIPSVGIRWIFLPFKQKVAWLIPILSGKAPWYKKVGALLLLGCCFPFAIFNIPAFNKINKSVIHFLERSPKGFGWILLAILITLLLWTPLGQEIGGMKVNLRLMGLTFQPSEITKYLILFFMAAFFTQNADTIIEYSQPNRTKLWAKIKTLGWVIGGLIFLMALYALLGDMGPALVIGIAFVLMYSLVKSKVNLDNLTEDDKWKRIFTCDFALMSYGIISFAACIIGGYLLGGIKISLLFALLWFVLWVIFGYLQHKQFFESAVIINILVFLFVFGGDIARQIPVVRDTDIAERFEQRTHMCVNTWGNPDIKHLGKEAEPVSNTQVANGLWAIATGGISGQGLGNGNPNLIPAFHTDMILSSIAEQTGWIGLLCIIGMFCLLLRHIVIIGYRVGHPFAFYFCIGVAIVIAVQFFIIALGSSGMIPLTGVSVPFLSYGRVSMMLNLAAVGIVLSLSKNVKKDTLNAAQDQVRRRSVGDYNYPVAIVTWIYVLIAVFTLGVWGHYAIWTRSKTLTHIAYVLSREGYPIIEYNPRIALLTREMWAGDIYDRKGILLATSNPDKLADKEMLKKYVEAGLKSEDIDHVSRAHSRRYYPFGNHLFFMLGDQNNGLFFSYDRNNPVGYMAEAQHLSYLRDYDNLHDKRHNPTPTVELKGKINTHSRFIASDGKDTTIRYRLRDNHELVKYLKKGANGRPLRKHNQKVLNGDFDLHLTLDAKLQTDLQNRISTYVQNTPSLQNNNLLRISVVVLDAKNGDLLSSANYPLPDYQRMREEDLAGNRYYNDNKKTKEWAAYTDRDLGLTYQTMPGSTAKVMSAMAGLQGLGTKAADKKYLVLREEIIESGSAEEPYKGKSYPKRKIPFTVNLVDMRMAIVESSNCYFINLVNDNDLYWSLDSVYETVGIRIDDITPYYLSYEVDDEKHASFIDTIQSVKGRALPYYKKYKESGKRKKMNYGDWQWAWGQGTMSATPLNMARVASTIVNRGVMPTTQYVLPTNKHTQQMRNENNIRLLSERESGILKDYMKEESANQWYRQNTPVHIPDFVGGKTGTPERVLIDKDSVCINPKTNKPFTLYYHKNDEIQWKKTPTKKNDGWYMFFIEGQDNQNPLAVCVRMERGSGSGAAVRLTKSVVLESLYANKYINEK